MSAIFHIDQLPNRTIDYQGQAYLFFSGTAYLGIPQHPAFHQLLTESMRRYGTVFGSSRNGNVRLAVYEEGELKLAARIGAESALTLSSGMIAGQVVISWLQSQHCAFVYAPKAHPALWHSPIVTLPQLSFTDWAAQLPDQLNRMPPGPVAILVNSLDAVCSDYYGFDWINTLPNNRSITLVVDDSHGLGVLTNGRGIWPAISCIAGTNSATIRVVGTGSLAKGMGLPGGVVFGEADTIKSIRQTAFFGACSPMPPAYLDAFLRADALYDQQQERLRRNVKLAEECLLPTGLFHHASGYPVFFTEHDPLYAQLLQKNIVIYSFAYPTAADRANTRVVISAFHEIADIEQLAKLISGYLSMLAKN